MELKTVKGMQDFLPEQAAKKQLIEETFRKVFERYGFKPMETPALEDFSLLSKKGAAGEAIKEEIYYFKDKGNRELGMRFDLTVPLARVVASNPSMPKPFKRYQIEKVWRYDQPQQKRWREFTQADADIIGTGSILAEFEIIAMTIDALKELGLKGKVKVNDRRLLEEVALQSGVKKEQLAECFRSIDKLDKIGKQGVEKELKEKGINRQILGQLTADLNSLQKKAKTAALLKELFEMLKENGVEQFVQFDLSLARGLEYYTGIVFEVVVEGPSIGGGGRYDNLIESFGGQQTPAIGISFGVERILDLLENKTKLENKTLVFVAPLKEEFNGAALKLAQQIRSLGIGVEIDLMQRKVGKNMEYVNKEGIPFAIVLGEKEVKEKKFRLKEMKAGKETEIKMSELEKLAKTVKSST